MAKRRQKGSQMAISTIIIMIVVLATVAILAAMTLKNGSGFLDSMKGKQDISKHTTECQIKCYNCCNGKEPDECGTIGDLDFNTQYCDCDCK